jgi:hypothetical protein
MPSGASAVEELFAYFAQINGSNLFYASGPLVDRTILSIETFSDGADVSRPGSCSATSNVYRSGAVTQFDLSTLGLVPPFTLP